MSDVREEARKLLAEAYEEQRNAYELALAIRRERSDAEMAMLWEFKWVILKVFILLGGFISLAYLFKLYGR